MNAKKIIETIKLIMEILRLIYLIILEIKEIIEAIKVIVEKIYSIYSIISQMKSFAESIDLIIGIICLTVIFCLIYYFTEK